MDEIHPRSILRPKDVIGGKCRVVLGTFEDAQGKERNSVRTVLKHR